MSRQLGNISFNDILNAFKKAGFCVARIKGSHHSLKKSGNDKVIVLVRHGNKPMKTGTLRSCIRNADMTIEEFLKFLEQ